MKRSISNVLPLPAAECLVTVCIPARDEAALIATTLAALTAQHGRDGSPLPRGSFDIIVFANNCNDNTAAVARAVAARTPHTKIFTVEARLHAAGAHIGNARKRVLDLAASRFRAAGKPDGIIASIDSDTCPAPDWVAAIMREMHGCDAVAGHVTIAEADQERLLAPVRLLYARELAYRRVIAEAEAVIDPLPEDPQPRHASFVGASFAVTTRAYIAAGGLPPLRRLEDLAFSRALRRIDARIRHSTLVRATTSARRTARVDGGFGTFIGELHACAGRGESFAVEHPRRTLEDLESRAAVRRIWQGNASADDIAKAATIFNLAPETWSPLIDPSTPFGTVYERIALAAESARRDYGEVPVGAAIDELRAAIVKARRAVTVLEETPVQAAMTEQTG